MGFEKQDQLRRLLKWGLSLAARTRRDHVHQKGVEVIDAISHKVGGGCQLEAAY